MKIFTNKKEIDLLSKNILIYIIYLVVATFHKILLQRDWIADVNITLDVLGR